ncbi:hypothetical protein BGZ73_005944 [Actinomortierella ambigua]|nr:hypothetical protein BGZ73_005944 [Actinomortierella ambigua]
MTATKTPSSSSTSNPPPRNVFRLHGVNVLNRKNVDSISRLTALEKRRATHILDERQRRDTMNQLLAELASLVRESAAELEKQQQEQQEQLVQLQAEQGENTNSAEQKKPPVKSNSITTLRNAIAEIRRLRSCMGLSTVTPPCPASLQQPSSRSRNTSPSSMASISSMPGSLSSNNSNNSTTIGSCNSTPMSSPKMSYRSISPQQQQAPFAASAPLPQPNYHHTRHYQQHYSGYPHPSSAYASPNGMQLQSPPLSPSSPSTHKHFANSPPMVGSAAHQIPSLPSLFAGSSSGSSSPSNPSYAHHPSPPLAPQYSPYYSTQHQHQKQQGFALPPLSAISPSSPSSMPSSSSSSSPAPPLLLPHPFMSAPSQPASVYAGASQFAPL